MRQRDACVGEPDRDRPLVEPLADAGAHYGAHTVEPEAWLREKAVS